MQPSMRAVVLHAAKDLRVETFATPEIKAGEVRVAMEVGGICGSDLHYYQDGGFGVGDRALLDLHEQAIARPAGARYIELREGVREGSRVLAGLPSASVRRGA